MSQERICVQKLSEVHKDTMNNIRNNSKNSDHFQKLSAAFWKTKLWRSGSEIKIAFLKDKDNIRIPRTSIDTMRGNPIDPLQTKFSNQDTDIIAAIKEIIQKRIIPLVNLKISFIDNPNDAQIRIDFDPDGGAWSMVGTDCLNQTDYTKPTMNLGWFDVGTVIHEFGHVLGMIHEHQNPLGKTIPWNVEAVDTWAKKTQGWDSKTTFTNIIQKYKSSSINGSEFDPKSIMLYFFPSSLTINNCCGTKQNFILSRTDAEWMNKIYPNGKNPNNIYNQMYGNNNESKNNLPLILGITIPSLLIIIGLIVFFSLKKKKN